MFAYQLLPSRSRSPKPSHPCEGRRGVVDFQPLSDPRAALGQLVNFRQVLRARKPADAIVIFHMLVLHAFGRTRGIPGARPVVVHGVSTAGASRMAFRTQRRWGSSAKS